MDKKSLRLRTIAFIAIVFGVLTFSTIYQSEQLEEHLPSLRERYQAAERVPNEVRYRIIRNWDGRGRVLVGRLILPYGVDISQRATIEDDGSFATAVYPGRTLEFYAHGYEPLIIEGGTNIAGSVFDTGEHPFTKSPPKRLRKLIGTVFLEETHANSPEVEVLLKIPNDATVSRDHGHWQRRTEPTAASEKIASREQFEFYHLSPIPYELVVRAEGYIEQVLTIQPDLRGTIDLGDVHLKKAQTLKFQYVSRIDIDKVNTWPAAEETTILCNGRTQFLFTDYRDKHRNRMRLRLTPKVNHVEAHFAWVPAEYYDLGEGSLSDYQSGMREINLEAMSSNRRLPLKDGHVYFFRHKGKDVNCLFSIKEL